MMPFCPEPAANPFLFFFGTSLYAEKANQPFFPKAERRSFVL